MTNPLIVTESVTFAPVRFPLKWADSAEHVPAWDVSRGTKFSRYWQEYPAPTEVLVPTTPSDYASEEKNWKGGVAPSETEAYPRLVCANPHQLSSDAMPSIKPSQAVAGLARFIGKPSFRQKVFEVASSYALLNPQQGDSLLSWEQFVRLTAFELFLVQAVNEAHADKTRVEPFNIKSALDHADTLMPEAARDVKRQDEYATFLFRRSEWLKDFNPALAAELTKVSFFQDRLPTTAGDASRLLYAYHWDHFEKSAEIKLAGGQFRAVCSLGVWVHYELALALRHASGIGTCAGCGQPFYIQHAKQMVCDPSVSRCRTRAKRRRDNA